MREHQLGAPRSGDAIARSACCDAEASILVRRRSIGGSFDYVKRRLGVNDAASAALATVELRNARLTSTNERDPTQPGYQSLLERAVLDAITRLHGRTLVLFTSRAQLRATYQALREPLAKQHITVLGQGIDESSRTRLLEAFRRGSRVALFGTNAFWEGIDVVGDALSCVIVARLPFAVPTDPIYAARAEQFEAPFMQYAVPQAVLRLKQGFGRLIRSRSDRGAVVILDRRLVTRFYGETFCGSLPPCSVKQGPLRGTAWRSKPGSRTWRQRRTATCSAEVRRPLPRATRGEVGTFVQTGSGPRKPRRGARSGSLTTRP